ncbi:ankyrin repeat protein [Catovirus CTV1]|uniref:Ankyrin repeat protein n=1 Tax=Catovirus CTV1 TaxID=1977631 RepID=A0A1V0S8V6_9VIRU|nr:ankyrin repeat protein [Catovirus CTV1]
MYWASQNGHLNVVRYLAFIANNTIGNNYALQSACENGHLDIVKYLISINTDINAFDNYPVIIASENGHLDIVKLLVMYGADIRDRNDSAIYRAYLQSHFDVVEYLIKSGAHIDKLDSRYSDELIYLLYRNGDLTNSIKLMNHFGLNNNNIKKILLKIQDNRNTFMKKLKCYYCDIVIVTQVTTLKCKYNDM